MKAYRIFIYIYIVLILILFFNGCDNSNKEEVTNTFTDKEEVINDLLIDKENSYFNDYIVKDNKVYLICTLVLRNFNSEGKTFSIIGDFSEDKEGGLLKESLLYAYDIDLNSRVFTIEGNELKTYEVCFVGNYAGQYQKKNRLLPQTITIIKQ